MKRMHFLVNTGTDEVNFTDAGRIPGLCITARELRTDPAGSLFKAPFASSQWSGSFQLTSSHTQRAEIKSR
jgi:hypothetical protein